MSMKVYDIETVFNRSQTHCVVAESMAEAERIFKLKYDGSIEAIKLHSEYVQVQGEETT